MLCCVSLSQLALALISRSAPAGPFYLASIDGSDKVVVQSLGSLSLSVARAVFLRGERRPCVSRALFAANGAAVEESVTDASADASQVV